MRTIAELLLRGEPFEEIAATFHYVEPAALQDVIGYYRDYRSEIDTEIEANELDNVLGRVGATLDFDGVVRFRDSSG